MFKGLQYCGYKNAINWNVLHVKLEVVVKKKLMELGSILIFIGGDRICWILRSPVLSTRLNIFNMDIVRHVMFPVLT